MMSTFLILTEGHLKNKIFIFAQKKTQTNVLRYLCKTLFNKIKAIGFFLQKVKNINSVFNITKYYNKKIKHLY